MDTEKSNSDLLKFTEKFIEVFEHSYDSLGKLKGHIESLEREIRESRSAQHSHGAKLDLDIRDIQGHLHSVIAEIRTIRAEIASAPNHAREILAQITGVSDAITKNSSGNTTIAVEHIKGRWALRNQVLALIGTAITAAGGAVAILYAVKK